MKIENNNKPSILSIALFTLIGALIALLPIHFGDLRFFEQLVVGTGLGMLSGLFAIVYNFIANPKVNLTYKDKMIAGTISAAVMVFLSTIL